MKSFDVVIVGAGLAGLQCARLLSRRGARILLVDRKTDLTKGVHTTGIFVRKTFEDFEFPAGSLGKPIRRVALYSPKLKKLSLESEKDEFRVGRMDLIYKEFLQESLESGVEFWFGTRYVSAATKATETIVRFEKKGREIEVKTKVLVGADGANSRVARDLKLDENSEWIVGFEEVFRAEKSSTGEPILHCFLDADLAPGYLAWAADDGEETHVGVGGYAEKFNPREALKEFKEKISAEIMDLKTAKLSETRGGRIPVGGVLQKIANENGLLIGDAAGAVSPLTAGGLDPCLRLSKMAADVIFERLKTDNPKVLTRFSGELFRARFVSRLWMRKIISIFTDQTLLEIGCFILRFPLFKKFASHVFFGRGSFPDVEIQTVREEKFTEITG